MTFKSFFSSKTASTAREVVEKKSRSRSRVPLLSTRIVLGTILSEFHVNIQEKRAREVGRAQQAFVEHDLVTLLPNADCRAHLAKFL
jgi:hypothetical protein